MVARSCGTTSTTDYEPDDNGVTWPVVTTEREKSWKRVTKGLLVIGRLRGLWSSSLSSMGFHRWLKSLGRLHSVSDWVGGDADSDDRV